MILIINFFFTSCLCVHVILFVSEKFLDDVREFLEAKKAAEIQEQLDEIKQFAGKGKIHERFNGLTSREIREKIAKEKYG